MNQLLARRSGHAAHSVPPSNVSSSVEVPLIMFQLPVPLSVDADVQGGDSNMDVPLVSVAPGLVSGGEPSPVSKAPPSPVVFTVQCSHFLPEGLYNPGIWVTMRLKGGGV